jgi:hypothetical protein
MTTDRHPRPNPRRALLLALGASTLLSACIVVPARGPYGSRAPMPPDDEGEVGSEPPPPQNEIIVAAPGPGFFWIAGYWAWLGGRHVWIRGRWENHRPGYRWVPHSWHRHGRGWRAAPGRWERH